MNRFFEIFDFKKMLGPWNRGQRSFKVIKIDTYQSATYDFPLTFHIVTTGLSRTVSEIGGDFSRKLSIFPTPVYFAPQLQGFILELHIGA